MDRAPPVNSLSLSQHLFEEIIEHCRAAYPHEACGIVAGKQGRAERVHCMTNVDPNPGRRFLIDAKEQLAVFREMHAAGQELVAIFHSHPRTPAYPSATDIDLAFYPDAFYLIVSMQTDPPDAQAFRINAEKRTVTSASVHVQSNP